MRDIQILQQTIENQCPEIHKKRLSSLILATKTVNGCTPIIVSDAGFRNTWFRQVANKGWFWLGRVRGEVSIKCGEDSWQWNKTFYPQATDKPQFLGESQLAKRSPLECFAYLYKSHPKGRKAHRHSRTCQKHSAGKVFHKGAKEP
ncbi:hypothetical protein [Vibrio campbellii]|uniref:Transposase IS4-like domain-containing protein n=1 Tax=Vibrio campbellii (strain ATCC BAA-1116) TaxID=2902295 RepID=A7MYH1_VIBC1|nr:hypothetical protein [Vibrio campbellii]ABU71557.1 hypothetical protein VIBHAR_02596 [Vibrio campbellii ATCC BAA-1116]AGU95908.1 hypothetical protein M892_00505 [Vibrio campbellii ATCC BAA-1116]